MLKFNEYLKEQDEVLDVVKGKKNKINVKPELNDKDGNKNAKV